MSYFSCLLVFNDLFRRTPPLPPEDLLLAVNQFPLKEKLSRVGIRHRGGTAELAPGRGPSLCSGITHTDKDRFREGLRLEIFLGDDSEKVRGRQEIRATAYEQSQQRWGGALE